MRKRYLTPSLLTISMSALAMTAWASGGHEGNTHADAEIDRTISVEAGDMWFDPDELRAAVGETIKFKITNTGNLEHEFVIGDENSQEKHRRMMQEMSENHGDAGHHMSEGGHGGGMPSVTVMPGETKELIWTVTDAENLEYACNIPGHYESGMYGKINLK